MKEKFEDRKLHGAIRIKLDDQKGYWEGDALKPDVMLSIVRKAIQEYTDMEVYSEII